MRIMRYHEIKQMNPFHSEIQGRYKLNPSFNLQSCQGEIIILLGSRVSCITWLHKLFMERQTLQKQMLAGSQTRFQLPNEAENFYKNLSPVHTIYHQIYQVIHYYQGYLGFNEKRTLAESYLTAAGLQAYRDLTPLQVPGLVIQQTKLALRFAAGHGVVLLDYLFDSLDAPEKGLLHMSLLNLQDSEKKPRTIIYATQHLEDAIFMADRILVMSPVKPGTVAENLSVWLPRPRNRHSLKSLPAYKTLLKLLQYLLTDAVAVEDKQLHKQLIS
jgi:ABC-type nitrate/sulfonate/bicarbonate transport system ATPase subunit